MHHGYTAASGLIEKMVRAFDFPPQFTHMFSSGMFSLTASRLVILGTSLLCHSALAVPAEVYLNQAEQEYDGALKFPAVTTDPLGLSVELSIIPRAQSKVVFQTIPTVPDPSYLSVALDTVPTDMAWGDEVFLGGGNRFLESIEIAMVNFSKAADYPVLALANPLGYLHPLSVLVYGVDEASNLVLLDQQTQEALIPWRPATLDDGGAYPLDGLAFNTRFNFNETVELPEKIVVLVAYNTEASGFAPLGAPGPYNQLSVAFGEDAPLVGTDNDAGEAIRFRSTAEFPEGVLTQSGAFDAKAPLFTVRTFSASPSPGTPLDAGGYRVSATITEAGYEGDIHTNFEVTPLEAVVSLADLRQVADGTPKTVTVVTNPSGLSAEVKYARRSTPPTDRGLYPAFVTLAPGNYVGKASGTLRLGYSYDSWIAEKIAGGSVIPEFAGKFDDPDFDGLVNFKEYLALSDPGTASTDRPSFLEIDEAPGGIMLAFDRNNDAIDVNYELQGTEDLSDPNGWTTLPVPAEGTLPFLGNERIEVPMPLTPGVSSKFFRLHYTFADSP